jgi:hypothetical protein
MMQYLRTYQVKWTALVLILGAFILQGLPLLNQEIEEQKFTQLMAKQFSSFDLENDQHEELLDTLQSIWTATENPEQWAIKASEYLTHFQGSSTKSTSSDLYHDILTKWSLFEQMGQRQESALLQEFRSHGSFLNTAQKHSKELLSSALYSYDAQQNIIRSATQLYDKEDIPNTSSSSITTHSIVIGAP